MAYGLTKRIFKHALSEGWLRKGDVVVDPFGGIGSTGIIGAAMGLRVVCVELEEKFVSLGKQNFELNRKAFEVSHFGHSYQPQIVQGDSRKLSEVIAGAVVKDSLTAQADCVVGSPPFQESIGTKDQAFWDKHNDETKNWNGATRSIQDYGQTPGQLGAMKAGSVDAVVSSPPFSDPNMQPTGKHQGVRSDYPKMDKVPEFKPDSPGNLGNLKPGDPVPRRIQGKVEAIISSPPWEDSVGTKDQAFWDKHNDETQNWNGATRSIQEYGETKGNIGNDKGETFWQAARQIVSECHKILKPGGHAIWVVKAFVRKGAIVDFPGDWRRLCEAQGFKAICTHHAMLVKETKHNGLFEEIVEIKEWKSFFRRLAEKKGSPKIDYEVVLCTEKPSDNL